MVQMIENLFALIRENITPRGDGNKHILIPQGTRVIGT